MAICPRADAEHGAEVLPEVHDHPSYQYAIALHGMRPYGFALPMRLVPTVAQLSSSST
ncbi:hypothetical protein [Sinimarinibacterium thermocellulolyticum]|uniref:Uncharacterized protein n=1 Tax=Sinimarinibacterium thermocellulolyticum TaxID=3170016 RepID=A0ABV2A8I1_9GAMM